jgi:uncharacterized OB-fold protein
MSQKAKVAVIEGWFTQDPRPQLIGARCTRCHTYFFPKTQATCSNPACGGTEFEEVPLSRTGRIWSYTENCFKPPEPYASPEPFVPYTVAAVELAAEKMVVLGQLEAGTDPAAVEVGTAVELVLGTLHEDEHNAYQMWYWRPCGGPDGDR